MNHLLLYKIKTPFYGWFVVVGSDSNNNRDQMPVLNNEPLSVIDLEKINLHKNYT